MPPQIGESVNSARAERHQGVRAQAGVLVLPRALGPHDRAERRGDHQAQRDLAHHLPIVELQKRVRAEDVWHRCQLAGTISGSLRKAAGCRTVRDYYKRPPHSIAGCISQ